ncbi:MAG: sigma 54-interacting transcriptional regulator [Bacillota bacterium]|jgi:PAS domain S-box-containing protein
MKENNAQTDKFLNMIRAIDLESLTIMARNLNVMIITIDQDLKLQYGNDVFFEVVGWPAERVLGQDYVKNFIPPEFRFVVRNTLLEIINKHVDNYSGSNHVMTKNHGTRYINWNAVHLSSSDNIRSMICIGIDITENTSLQNILQRTALEKTLIIDSIKEFVFYRNETGGILEANEAFHDWSESRQETIIGSPCYKILHNLNRQCPNCPLSEVLTTGKTRTIYTTLPDGSKWEEKMHILKADGIHPRQIMVVMAPLDNDVTKKFSIIKSEHSKQGKNVYGTDEIKIFSSPMQKVIEQAKILHKDRSVPVLIEGETGTGKELIARFIHFGPRGTERPFVDINCAAITPTIFESELFGYEGGAFTGGRSGGQKGKLDLAQGGSLFLDELGEIPVSMQAKLLRVIQEKEYYRVGGLKKQEADVRLICATNVNLEKNIKEGSFRKDLFYRLEAVRIHIPPLRLRKDDILPLAQWFLKTAALKKGKYFKSISEEAASFLTTYPWPGNVRQLKNTIEYIVIMFDDNEVKLIKCPLCQDTNFKI